MKTIELTVAPDGSTSIETKGFTGAECREASQFLEQSLGQTTAEHLTSDFHTTQATEAQQQLKQ